MTFFGPEVPAPFSVISENYFNEIIDTFDSDLIDRNDANIVDDYDLNLCNLIANYLDIDCMDSILFMKCINNDNVGLGDVPGKTIKNWPRVFESKFCLVKPIHMCQVSQNEETGCNKYTFYKIMTKFEQRLANGQSRYEIHTEIIEPVKYDKIIVKNCLKFFEKSFKVFTDFVMNLFKSHRQIDNSLLVIQRIADLNTLPFYTQILTDWSLNDTKYTKFIQTLQCEHFHVKWDIEIVNCCIKSKTNWYGHLKQKYTYPLNENIVNEATLEHVECVHGIRELNEGFFKYQKCDEYIELYDRLLFIGSYHRGNDKLALAERKIKESKEKRVPAFKQKQLVDEINQISMQITPEIQTILTARK